MSGTEQRQRTRQAGRFLLGPPDHAQAPTRPADDGLPGRMGTQLPHTPSLRDLLPLCPDDVRVGAWVKPFHAYKKGVRPAYAWEPLIYRGGRNTNPPVPPKGGKAITPKDFVSCNITLRKSLTGAKPEPVCEWILDLLNVQPGDTVDDLYPGTGVMSAALAARVEDTAAKEGEQ